MKALVTGGSGVVGANLVRELLDAGWTVRTLVRPGPPRRALLGLPLDQVEGDVLDPASLAGAVDGMDVVFHAAARFTYDADPVTLNRLAVEGTRNAIRAAAGAGVGRVVLTSSSVVFGSSPRPIPRDEDAPFTPEDGSAYAVSKVAQMRAARAAATAAGVDLVAVCPTVTVGAFDYRLSTSNAAIVTYLNDPFRTTFEGGCNVVSARDVARGHRLVAERGATGGAYLLGGENAHWREVHETVSAVCGTTGPLVTATHTGAYLTAVWCEMASWLTGVGPALTRDQVRMMGRWYWYDDARARALGYRPRSVREALEEAVGWLLRADHVRPEVKALLRFREGSAPPPPAIRGSNDGAARRVGGGHEFASERAPDGPAPAATGEGVGCPAGRAARGGPAHGRHRVHPAPRA